MNVYIYQGDLYCEQCGEAIKEKLTRQGFALDDPGNKAAYDSGEFPKGPYPDGGGEADCPQHCGTGAECCNSILLANGNVEGAWLENPLITEGVEYVRRAIQKGGELAELWMGYYRDVLQEEPSKGNANSTFNFVDFILALESGELGAEETVEGFQHLIDTGLCWKLQGTYGRTAAVMIQKGHCIDTHNYLGRNQ